MKKALSLLLVLCMLATLCTVPVFAEDETLDLPVIEEVTEEEMEEVDLFGEVDMMTVSPIVDVTTSDDDGMTLLSDIEGATVTYAGEDYEGYIPSLYNGQITVGDDLGERFVKNGGNDEGAMLYLGKYLTIDLGKKMNFTGIRVWESSRTRYYGTEASGKNAPGARRIGTSDIKFSDDGENWYGIHQATAVYNEEGHYSDLQFMMNAKGMINLNARYIRLYATKDVVGWGQVEFEEIAMLDAVTDLNDRPTWSLNGHEIPTSAIESVTPGSQWNTTSYAATHAWNNYLSLTDYWHSMPNDANYDNDPARTLTIKLKEKTKIGGVRIWPRNDGTYASPDQNTATIRNVVLMGSTDGENYWPLTTATGDINGKWSAVKYCSPLDFVILDNVDNEVNYIKIVGKKVTAYICVAEFQLLDEDVQTKFTSKYNYMDDVVKFKSPAPSVIGGGNSYDNGWRNVTTNPFSGIVYQNVNTAEGFNNPWTGAASGDPHMEDNFVYFDGDKSGTAVGPQTAWADIDLGYPTTFSAVRLFGRWNQPGQSFTKGYILVSDDNVNWYRAEDFADTYTNVGGMAKYTSTGDVYTDIPAKFGENVNITARYVRIYTTATGGGDHWSWQQVMLVKPKEANATYTVTELVEDMQAEVEAFEEEVNALPTEFIEYSEEVAKVEAAYNALPEAAKTCVSAEALAKLAAAKAANSGFVCNAKVTQNNGLTTATFTLPKRDVTEIKSVKYTTTLGKELDGKDATTVSVNGDKMTISIAGAYTNTTGLNDISGGKGNYYYTATNTSYPWWIANTPVLPEHFTGLYTRLVAVDGLGDHIINLTFADDVTYKLNIRTTPNWITLSGAKAIAGSEYSDEIAPKTTWKVTATNGGDLSQAFDGTAEYLLRKAGSTAGNRYESDYLAGSVKVGTDGTGKTEVIMYKPVRFDFILDTGEATTVSGARMYPRIGTYKEDKTQATATGIPTKIVYWGSNNGNEWDKLGEYSFDTKGTEKTAYFEGNKTYRYFKGSVLAANYAEYRATVNISEFVLITPKTVITSAENITVDASEGNKAEFEFVLIEGDSLVSLKDAKGADVAYTFENGVLAIAESYVEALESGEYAFTVTFAKGEVYNLKVTKIDNSNVTYKIFSRTNEGDGALVLKKLGTEAVTGVKIVGGKDITIYNVTNENRTISIPRQIFKRSADLFALTDVDKNGEVKVAVSYEGGEKIYTVTIVAEWGDVLGTNGEFLADELVADNAKWKARTSSAQSQHQPGYLLSKAAIGIKDSQNWHSYFGAVNGTTYGDSTSAQGHYIDIDFGGQPDAYVGLRHTERPGGTTWNANVTVWGKNEANGQWVEIYNAKPTYKFIGKSTEGVISDIYQGEMLFAEPVNYRYLRIRIKSTSEHITGDTLHIIKDVARLTGASEAEVDKTDADVAAFEFYVPGAGNVKVMANGAEVAAESYALKDGILTFNAAYIATLPVGKNVLDVTIDGMSFALTITKVDKYAVTYILANATNFRGTDDLVLPVTEGMVPEAVKYGDKNVTYTFADGAITIKRYNFRGLDDMFDMTSLKLTVTFEGDIVRDYTISLVNEGAAVTGVSTEEGAFKADEIKPVNGEWTVKASSSNNAGNGISSLFTMTAKGLAWHSAYTEVSGSAVPDTQTNRLHIEVDFGKATKLSGFRYYLRQDVDGKGVKQTAGVWSGATIYGRSDADDEWTLIKSQTFNAEATQMHSKTYAEVYFNEDVTFSQVRIDIECNNLATGRGLTFMNARPAQEEPEEDEVNIQITPTTGGNVTVSTGEDSSAPSLGDNYVAVNSNVTFNATPNSNANGGFMYWVEANTGKILGKDTSLTVKSATGKDIKAVFADPSAFEVFVSFFGRNANSVIAHSYVKKGEAPKIPSNDKLYTTGYEFKYWTNADGVEMDMTETVDANTEFYAFYEAKGDKTSKITVVGGKVRMTTNEDEASTEATYTYDTAVKVIANAPADGEKFSHWEIAGEIVSYEKTYKFFAPDADITVTAVFVASDAVVEEEINITMTKTLDSINGVAVASFLTTRYVPSGVEVLETGVIYVKDASYGDLTIADIGKTSANGKAVKVATCDKTTSGQYKLTASYAEFGIKAVGFITYVEDGAVKTIYTEALSQN